MKKFSVVIPVYNGGKTISRTLASLISNKDEILEVIVVNDRSIDNTVAVVRKFQDMLPITIIKNKGEHNPGAARKTGLLKAKGEWITFVDADDCLTPSSLYYVDKQLNDKLVLLYCESIYYETGTFNPDDVTHSDGSCGGNFYRREYLIKHKLFPHDTLKMSEDEYFNGKIRMYLDYLDPSDPPKWAYYDYPVYEVHHDLDRFGSFAIDNWIEYAIKYHLLSTEYLIEDFLGIPEIVGDIKCRFTNDFIFAYMIFQGLITDEDVIIDVNEQMSYFKRALNFYLAEFNTIEQEIIDYYNNNPDMVKSLYQGAVGSIGRGEFEITQPFDSFVKSDIQSLLS